MGNRLSRNVLRRAALTTICVGAGVCAVPAISSAATTITPASFTDCSGGLTPDSGAKKAKEPGLVDYSFSCNSGITAYTILADQSGDPQGAITDYLGSPLVYETDDLTPSPTETVTCEGTQPSNGINCNTGNYLSEITGAYYIAGSIDLAQTYCKHLPTTSTGALAKPGTPAVPAARVQIVVTDWTGAEDGPFSLKLPAKDCPTVANKVPEPVVTTPVKTEKTTTKKSTSTKSKSSKTSSSRSASHSTRAAH